MKANQHLGHEKTTQTEVHNGFRSVPDDVEIITPSRVQPVGHESEAGPTKELNLKTRIEVLLKMKGEAGRLMGRPQTYVCESIIDKQSGLYDPSYFTYQLDIEINKSNLKVLPNRRG